MASKCTYVYFFLLLFCYIVLFFYDFFDIFCPFTKDCPSIQSFVVDRLSFFADFSLFIVLPRNLATLVVTLSDPSQYGNTGCGVFKRGVTKLERFLHKNQHTQRNLLNFEFWINGELSKIGHHFKGQIISECPYEIIFYPKIATKNFQDFCPGL